MPRSRGGGGAPGRARAQVGDMIRRSRASRSATIDCGDAMRHGGVRAPRSASCSRPGPGQEGRAANVTGTANSSTAGRAATSRRGLDKCDGATMETTSTSCPRLGEKTRPASPACGRRVELSDNGGGLSTGDRDRDMFVERGRSFARRAHGQPDRRVARAPGGAWSKVPLTVLINKARPRIRGRRRRAADLVARIVGESSYGKGLGAGPFELGDGGAQ